MVERMAADFSTPWRCRASFRAAACSVLAQTTMLPTGKWPAVASLVRMRKPREETVGGGVRTFVGLIGRCVLDGCKIRVPEDGIFHLLIQGRQMQGQIGFLLFPKVGKEVIAIGAVESPGEGDSLSLSSYSLLLEKTVTWAVFRKARNLGL